MITLQVSMICSIAATFCCNADTYLADAQRNCLDESSWGHIADIYVTDRTVKKVDFEELNVMDVILKIEKHNRGSQAMVIYEALIPLSSVAAAFGELAA